MRELFLSVVEISVSTSLVILALLLFSRGLNKRYLAKWKYFIWIALALRLAVPVKLELELPRQLPQREIVFEVPAGLAAPIAGPADLGPVVPVMPQTPQVPQAPGISPLDVLAYIWLAGCVLFLLAHVGSYLAYRRRVMVRGERVRDLNLISLIRGLAKDLGISYRIPIRDYSGASSPMVLGFFRPILILPDTEYREEELRFILRHELIHLKRHDIFFKFLFVFANALHWFNPVAYLLRQSAVVDMELSCDETVVQDGGYDTRKAYTETLLSTLCRQYRKSTDLSTQFYGGKQVMKLRFKNLLGRNKKKSGLIIFLAVVVIIAIFGTVIGFTTGDPQDPTPTGDDITWASLDFAEAFVAGDREAMETALDGSFEGDLEVYPYPAEGSRWFDTVEDTPEFGDISNHSWIWPSVFSKTVPLGSTYTVEVRHGGEPDGEHLHLSLVSREDGWKIREYAFIPRAISTQGMTEWEAAEQIALQVAMARFHNDLSAMSPYMVDGWEGMIWNVTFDQFPDASQLRLVEAPRPGDVWFSDEPVPVGATTTIAIEVNDVNDSDNFIVCLIRQENGWRAYDFGFEKLEGFGNEEAESTNPAADEKPSERKAALEAAYNFTEACLRGDTAAMEPLMADSFDGTLKAYQSPDYILVKPMEDGMTNYAAYRLISSAPDNIYQTDISIGCVLKLAVRLNSAGDELILSQVRQEDGWKITRYDLVTGQTTEAVPEDERSEMERMERLFLQNSLEYYAYMVLDEAPEELKPVILEARHRIILSSDWVADDQDAWVKDENGTVIETVPHFSDVFPSDWEIPVEKMTEDEKREHGQLQTLIDPERTEIMAMFQASMEFTRAYIGGDLETVRSYLAYSYMEPLVYEGPELQLGDLTGKISFAPVPSDLSTDINDYLSIFSKSIPLGSTMTMAVDLRDFGAAAGFERFAVSLCRLEEGWKVADFAFLSQGPTASQEDSRQIEALVMAFSDEFFAGRSAKELRKYLSEPYDEFSENFAGDGGFTEAVNYRNFPRPGDTLPADGHVPIIIDFHTEESPDSYLYLQMDLIKQDGQWKIYSYIVDV